MGSCEPDRGDCDGAAETGCETDLLSDPAHCGACGHGCQGGACSGGACQPVVLAAGQGGLGELAIDADTVYFTAGSRVLSVPKAGGAPKTLAAGQLTPTGIATDATRVYWTNAEGGTVKSVTKSGSSPVTLASNADTLPFAIALYDESDSFVYFVNRTTSGAVFRVPKDGSEDPTMVAGTGQLVWSVATDLTHVYWPDTDAQGHGVIVASGKVNGVTTTIATDPQIFTFGDADLAVDDTNVYWTNPSAHTVRSAHKDGSGSAKLLAQSDLTTSAIAIDEQSVYWTSGNTALTEGEISRVDKSGGEPVTFVGAQAGPFGIAVDDVAVYWTNFGDGTLMKLAK